MCVCVRHLPKHKEIRGKSDQQPIQPEFPGKNGERLTAADKDNIDEDGDSDPTPSFFFYSIVDRALNPGLQFYEYVCIFQVLGRVIILGHCRP